MTKTLKKKSSATGNLLIYLKSRKLLDKRRRKSLLNSNPKFIVSEKNGKKEELVNYVCLNTKQADLLECLLELIRLTNAS